ncbi:MAG: YibE/F family protein [Thomasclavelia ramosa]
MFYYCQLYFQVTHQYYDIICVALSTIVTLMLLNGASKKTYSAIVATVCVVLSAGDFVVISTKS